MQLNTENIRFRQKAGNSLTDLNHIDLFTDRFQNIREGQKKKGIEQAETIQNTVFQGEMAEEDDYEELQSLLFSQQTESATEVLNKTDEEGTQTAEVLLFSVFMAGLFYILLCKSRKKRGERIA